MNSVYIIAEAGVNHNGSLDLAHDLIDAAKNAGANAVKFQTFKTEKLLTQDTALAEYQYQSFNEEINSQYRMIKKLELEHKDFIALKKHADNINIDFLSTPDDDESLNFLVDVLDLNPIKIGSGEITNLIFLEEIARKNRDIILSTGMSSLGEVERAVLVLQKHNSKKLSLLHCTTSYPCQVEDVNLRSMITLKQAFNLDSGYSDHTLGKEIAVAAVALGAQIIEKHITLDNNLKGPDHRASLNPCDFTEMVRMIRSVEIGMGTGIKLPTKSEESLKQVIRRRIVSLNKMTAGTKIDYSNICYKRANEGIFCENIDQVIGRRLNCDIDIDRPIEWNYLQT